MSSWVEVHASFECGPMNGPPLQWWKTFGMECVPVFPYREAFDTDEAFHVAAKAAMDSFQEERNKWIENPEAYLPMGSEGTLNLVIVPLDPHEEWYIVTVYGSLRDADSSDFDEIAKWFDRSCKKCIVNHALCWMSDGIKSRILQCHNNSKMMENTK